MRPLINSREEEIALRAEAATWLGTPFAPRQMVKDAGVDCVHLPLALLRAMGGRFATDFPSGYTVDRSKHCDDSLVLNWLESASPEIERLALFTSFEEQDNIITRQKQIAVIPIAVGDVVTFKLNRHVDHIGVMMNAESFMHAVSPQGVISGHIFDPTFAKTIHSIWRPFRLAP